MPFGPLGGHDLPKILLQLKRRERVACYIAGRYRGHQCGLAELSEQVGRLQSPGFPEELPTGQHISTAVPPQVGIEALRARGETARPLSLCRDRLLDGARKGRAGTNPPCRSYQNRWAAAPSLGPQAV
jgi:hypothetical protein